MEWNVSPVSHNAGALFSPGHAPPSRKVIPVKGFHIEFTNWPPWESIQNVALSDGRILSAGSVGRLWKVVFEIQVGSDADEKDPFPVLRDAEVSGVQHGPLDPVARCPVTAELIFQQRPALTECHSVDVLNDKRFWFHLSKHAIEFTIQKVNRVAPASFPALAVALAWIAAHK
jgi:hypothetical protein